MKRLPNYHSRRTNDLEHGVWYISDYKNAPYEELRKAIRNNLLDIKRLSEVSDILSQLTIKNEYRMQFNAYELLLDHLLDETDHLLADIAERFY